MSSYSPTPKMGTGGWPFFSDTEGRFFLTSGAERAPRLSATSTGPGHAAPRLSHHGRNLTLARSLSSTLPPAETPPQRAHHPNSHTGRNNSSTDLVPPIESETVPNPASVKKIQRCRNCRAIGHNRVSCQKMYCYFHGTDNHMWRKYDEAAAKAREERANIQEMTVMRQRGF